MFDKLYNSFGGKDALFEKAMELYIEQRFSQLREKLEDEEQCGETVRRFVQLFGKPHDRRSKDCLLRKTLLHNAASPEQPKEVSRIGEYLTTLWKSLCGAIPFAKRKKAKPMTDEERAALLVALLFGSAVVARNGRNTDLLGAITSGATKLIEQDR